MPGLNEIALSKVVDIVADAENDVAESQMAKIVWANFVQIPGQKQDQKPLLLGRQFFTLVLKMAFRLVFFWVER